MCLKEHAILRKMMYYIKYFKPELTYFRFSGSGLLCCVNGKNKEFAERICAHSYVERFIGLCRRHGAHVGENVQLHIFVFSD